MTEWNIQSRAHACAGCGNPFAAGEAYHTLLFDERAEFRRSDVCQGCWERQFSQGARERKGFISYWQGVYEAPPPRPPDPIQKETAESLLRKLLELNDPRFIPAGFILAVMLERKRLLKVREQRVRDGRRVFIYEHPASGDVFTILDPGLQLNQLESVQRDVADLLEHGLNPPAPGTPASAGSLGTPALAGSTFPSTTAQPSPPAPGAPASAGSSVPPTTSQSCPSETGQLNAPPPSARVPEPPPVGFRISDFSSPSPQALEPLPSS